MNHNSEQYERQQNRNRSFYEKSNKFRIIFVNIILIVMSITLVANIVRYLTIDNRTAKENEQLMLSCIFLVVFVFLGVLINVFSRKLREKFVAFVAKTSKNKDSKDKKQISDLNMALHMISQCTGVIVWDTIWGSFAVFLAVCLLFFFKNGNPQTMICMLGVTLVFLLGGHIIGKKIWKKHRFDQRLLKHTKKYIAMSDEEEYRTSVDESIQKGILCYTRQWILTDKYMIGRLSDVTFEPVVIPREMLEMCTFFYERKINSRGGFATGILKCKLKNGGDVELAIGREKMVNPVLEALNAQKIPWNKSQTRYQ